MKKALSLLMLFSTISAYTLPALGATNTIINENKVIVTDSGTTTETKDYYSTDNPSVVELTIGKAFLKAGNTTIDFNVPTYIQSNYAMLPLRAVASAVGGIGHNSAVSVTWDSNTKTVLINCKDKEITFKPGSNVMTVNGKSVTMGVYAEIKNGQTFVPLRSLCEALDIEVEWIKSTKTIRLYK